MKIPSSRGYAYSPFEDLFGSRSWAYHSRSAIGQGPYQDLRQVFWLWWYLFVQPSNGVTWKYWYERACHQVDRGKTTTLWSNLCFKPRWVRDFEDLNQTHLKTEIIRPLKSPASASILFDKKPDSSFCLCIDYQDLNNLTIKNWYPLPLIGKVLDCLGQVKQFIELDLTIAYHRKRIREGDK